MGDQLITPLRLKQTRAEPRGRQWPTRPGRGQAGVVEGRTTQVAGRPASPVGRNGQGGTVVGGTVTAAGGAPWDPPDPELDPVPAAGLPAPMAEIQAESKDRLLPMPVLPAWDVDACIREAGRVADFGLRGVNLTSDPQDLGAPDLANQAWYPLWEACSALRLPVHFHIGASLTTMTYFGSSVGLPTRGHQAGHRRRPAVHRERPGRDEHHPVGNGRPAPGAEHRLGRERCGVDPLHTGRPGLRDVGERPEGPREAGNDALRVPQTADLCHLLVSRRTTCPH